MIEKRMRGFMEKIMKKLMLCILTICLILNVPIVRAAEQNTNIDAKHYNTMIVVDGSGSLKNTDGKKYRYDAIELFLGVLTNEGNHVGAIVFNDEKKMPLDTGLTEIKSMIDKKVISEAIRKADVKGDTDIGSAIEQALKDLQGKGADKNLPSSIVLLSDGETDLGDAKSTKASLEKKDKMVKQAQKLGIPIHGICLNANNSANTQEVKNMAESTGGIYIEIKDAADLDKAFLEFYSLVYGEEVDSGDWEQFGDEGYIEKKFQVPTEGVMEVNILIQGKNKGIVLTKPNGDTISGKALDSYVLSTSTYEVVKITNPDAGIWNIKVDGKKGTQVKFDWVYNTDLSADIECEADQGKVALNSEIPIKGYLLSDGEKVENEAVYTEYTATLKLQNAQTQEEKEFPMQADGASFVSNVKLDDYGTYYASLRIECGNVNHTSKQTMLNVGNEEPIASQTSVTEKVTLMPFSKGEVEFDLNQYMSDPEGDALTYELKENDYDADKISLNGNKLSVQVAGVKKGNIKVTGTDSQGASCEMSFQIETKNMLPIIIGIIVAIIAVVIIIIALINKGKKSGVFGGTITIASFDDVNGQSSNPFPVYGFKYMKNLKEWNIIECGINGEFYVTPPTGAEKKSGKTYSQLYFESKQKFVTEDDRESTRILLAPGNDVKIYTSHDMERGIEIIVSEESMNW